MASLADLPFNPTDNGMGAELAQGALYGDNQMAAGWRMLEHVPGVAQTAGWNAWRASNTIMNASGGGKTRGRIRNHLPGNLTKMSSYENIADTGKYTPFDFLARSGNWAGRAVSGKTWTPGAATADDIPLFSSGAYSRLSTASRLSMSSNATAMQGAREFVWKTNPSLAGKINATHAGALSNVDMGHYVAGSQRGIYSNAINGYVRGAMHGPVSSTVSGNLAKEFTEGVALKRGIFGGAARGAEHIALGGGEKAFARAGFKMAASKGGSMAAAKFGLGSAAKVAGYATPGVNIAMLAWTAVDLTKMGLEATKAIPGFTRDALNSFKGGIQKPVMGSRYVDNSVAATSRQRGVMAIQNSQLNMRSALGNEAAGLHAYYG